MAAIKIPNNRIEIYKNPRVDPIPLWVWFPLSFYLFADNRSYHHLHLAGTLDMVAGLCVQIALGKNPLIQKRLEMARGIIDKAFEFVRIFF